MGYNATIMLNVDGLDQIARDKDFGANLAEGTKVCRAYGGHRRADVRAGNHGNVAHVAGAQHSDETRLFVTHGNLCEQLDQMSDDRFPLEEIRRELTKRGYRVIGDRPHWETSE